MTFLQEKIHHDKKTQKHKRIVMLCFEVICLMLFIIGILFRNGFFIAFGLLHGLVYLIHFPNHYTAFSDLAFFGFKPFAKKWPFYRQLLFLVLIEVCLLFMALPFLSSSSIVFSFIGLSTALFLILLLVFVRRFLDDFTKTIDRNR